jgi:cellulose synthase operon protein YhjQ
MPLILFGSPKGGVGKTTTAANVSAVLAQAGFRVVVLDLDPQNALRLHFGVPLHDGTGFATALISETPTQPLTAFLRQTQWGIGLLPFGQVDTVGAMAVANALARRPQPLTQLLQDLLADPRLIVIVDSPPGPSSALAAVLPYTDMLVCVLLADAISVSLIPSIEAGRAFGPGTQQGVEGGRLRYVLNQFDPLSRLSQATAEAVRPYLGARLLGEVRRDELVAEAGAGQCPLPYFAPTSIAAADIRGIAQNIAAAFGMMAQSETMR